MSTSTSVALDRKLTSEETHELKLLLMPICLVGGGEDGASTEDINDLLDYAFAMVNNAKSVDNVVEELIGMEMQFCNSDMAHKIGQELATFLNKLVNGSTGGAADESKETSESKIASLKVRFFLKNDQTIIITNACGWLNKYYRERSENFGSMENFLFIYI